jgi:hypothetical protein
LAALLIAQNPKTQHAKVKEKQEFGDKGKKRLQ